VCCKDTARKCNPKKCKKRQMFAKSCQATCAAHCLKDKKNKKCPKDKNQSSNREATVTLGVGLEGIS